MVTHEATENYLETIYILSQQLKEVRAVDICNHLGYSRPTVSAVVKNFKAEGYIEVDGNNFITLTDKGKEIAEKMYERHNIIARIFMVLGVSKEVAYEDACRVEHYISDETFQCMKSHFLDEKPLSKE